MFNTGQNHYAPSSFGSGSISPPLSPRETEGAEWENYKFDPNEDWLPDVGECEFEESLTNFLN